MDFLLADLSPSWTLNGCLLFSCGEKSKRALWLESHRKDEKNALQHRMMDTCKEDKHNIVSCRIVLSGDLVKVVKKKKNLQEEKN